MIKYIFSLIFLLTFLETAHSNTERNVPISFIEHLLDNPNWNVCNVAKIQSYGPNWTEGKMPHIVTLECDHRKNSFKIQLDSANYVYPGTRFLVLNPVATVLSTVGTLTEFDTNTSIDEAEKKRIVNSSSSAFPVMVTNNGEYVSLSNRFSLTDLSDEDYFVLTKNYKIINSCQENLCKPQIIEAYFVSLEALELD